MSKHKIRIIFLAVFAAVLISACSTTSSTFNVRLINATVTSWTHGAAQLIATNVLNGQLIKTGTIDEAGVMDLELPATLLQEQLKTLVLADLEGLFIPSSCNETLTINLNGASAAIISNVIAPLVSEEVALAQGNTAVNETEGTVTTRLIIRVYGNNAIQVTGDCETIDPTLGNVTGTFSINAPSGWSLIEVSLTLSLSGVDGNIRTVSSTNLPWTAFSNLILPGDG